MSVCDKNTCVGSRGFGCGFHRQTCVVASVHCDSWLDYGYGCGNGLALDFHDFGCGFRRQGLVVEPWVCRKSVPRGQYRPCRFYYRECCPSTSFVLSARRLFFFRPPKSAASSASAARSLFGYSGGSVDLRDFTSGNSAGSTCPAASLLVVSSCPSVAEFFLAPRRVSLAKKPDFSSLYTSAYITEVTVIRCIVPNRNTVTVTITHQATMTIDRCHDASLSRPSAKGQRIRQPPSKLWKLNSANNTILLLFGQYQIIHCLWWQQRHVWRSKPIITYCIDWMCRAAKSADVNRPALLRLLWTHCMEQFVSEHVRETPEESSFQALMNITRRRCGVWRFWRHL